MFPAALNFFPSAIWSWILSIHSDMAAASSGYFSLTAARPFSTSWRSFSLMSLVGSLMNGDRYFRTAAPAAEPNDGALISGAPDDPRRSPWGPPGGSGIGPPALFTEREGSAWDERSGTAMILSRAPRSSARWPFPPLFRSEMIPTQARTATASAGM